MVKTKTHCPAINIGEIEVCDLREVEPLLEFLRSKTFATEPRSFQRGTVLPDGRLDLCKQSIGPDGATQVLEALRGNPHIRSVMLGTDAIGAAGARAVGELLASQQSNLETLYLGCNRIEGDAVAPITTELESSPRVSALWLKRNPLGLRGAEHVARATPSLEVLDVFNCELGDEGTEVIANASDELRALVIGANGAGNRGIAALAELLSRTTSLEDLNLNATHLGDDGAIELARGLAANRSLRRLKLASCSIGTMGAKAIAQHLANHESLEVLDLSHVPAARALGEHNNSIGNDCAADFASLIEQNSPLRSLDLRNAGLRSPGALVLEAALENQTHLAYLGVSRFVSRRIRRRIAALLERNRSMHGAVLPDEPAYVSAIRSVYRNPPRS